MGGEFESGSGNTHAVPQVSLENSFFFTPSSEVHCDRRASRVSLPCGAKANQHGGKQEEGQLRGWEAQGVTDWLGACSRAIGPARHSLLSRAAQRGDRPISP